MSKGSDKELIRNHYEYTNNHRHPEWGDRGLVINELNICNSNIKCGKTIPIKMKMNSNQKNEGVRFRFEFAPMTIPKKAATMITNKSIDFDKNETKELSLEIDTKHLIPSRYQVDIVAFTTDKLGKTYQVGAVYPGFVFDIDEGEDNEKIIWKTYNWGAVHLQDISIKEKE